MSSAKRQGPKPDLDPHKHFHPDLKGYVHLQRDPTAGSSIDVGKKTVLPVKAGGYEGSFPVAVLHRIEHWLPELQEHFLEQIGYDSRISINTVYHKKRWPSEDDYKRIASVWIDCDCEDLDYFEAVEKVYALQARGVVPPISVIANTGRGIHVYWLLTGGEDDPTMPPKAWRKNRVLLVQINEAIGRRVGEAFPELKPDLGAVYITTHQRVAGSINTKTGTEVAYTVNIDKEGNPPRYTFAQLAEHFGIEPHPSRYKRTKKSKGEKQPQKRTGWVANFEQRLAEVQIVRSYMEAQGGFKAGTRRHAVHLVVTLMRPCGYSIPEMEREALAVAGRCNPPLPKEEAKSELKSALKKQRKPRNKTIARKLGVTVELADQLELKKIRPDFRPPKGTGNQTANREARLRFLGELAEKHGNPLPFTYRELDAELKAAGLPTPRGTVQNYLKLLELRTRDARGPRPDVHQDSLID